MTAFIRRKPRRLFVVAGFAAGMFAFDTTETRAQGEPAGAVIQTAALSAPARPANATPAVSDPSRFSALSPSNQTIARALFDVQSNAENGWTLDRIAAARQAGQGWGRIFRAMKADGALVARTLNEAVGAARYSGENRPARAGYGDVRVSTGNGQSILIGQGWAAIGPARPMRIASSGAAAASVRIELGRVVVSDFERHGHTGGQRHARPISLTRVYRD